MISAPVSVCRITYPPSVFAGLIVSKNRHSRNKRCVECRFFCLFQHPLQILSREAGGAGRHLLRRTGDHNGAAAVAPLRAKVDEVVGALDDVQIVLDDEHGVARVDKALQNLKELFHIVRVETRGRLVEDIDGAPRGALRKLGRELDALGFAAGERRRRLAEARRCV